MDKCGELLTVCMKFDVIFIALVSRKEVLQTI